MRGPFKHYLEILGLDETASAVDIKKAYHRLAQQWHPDKVARDPEKLKVAHEKMRLINEAYKTLENYQPPPVPERPVAPSAQPSAQPMAQARSKAPRETWFAQRKIWYGVVGAILLLLVLNFGTWLKPRNSLQGDAQPQVPGPKAALNSVPVPVRPVASNIQEKSQEAFAVPQWWNQYPEDEITKRKKQLEREVQEKIRNHWQAQLNRLGISGETEYAGCWAGNLPVESATDHAFLVLDRESKYEDQIYSRIRIYVQSKPGAQVWNLSFSEDGFLGDTLGAVGSSRCAKMTPLNDYCYKFTQTGSGGQCYVFVGSEFFNEILVVEYREGDFKKTLQTAADGATLKDVGHDGEKELIVYRDGGDYYFYPAASTFLTGSRWEEVYKYNPNQHVYQIDEGLTQHLLNEDLRQQTSHWGSAQVIPEKKIRYILYLYLALNRGAEAEAYIKRNWKRIHWDYSNGIDFERVHALDREIHKQKP